MPDLAQWAPTSSPADAFSRPSFYGWLGATVDPALANSALVLNGVLRVGAIALAASAGSPVTIANLITFVSTAGAGLTAGQCRGAVWKPDGTLIARTADLSGVLNSVGLKVMPLVAEPGQSLTVTSRYVMAGITAPGATEPELYRLNQPTNAENVGATAPDLRGGYVNTPGVIPNPLAAVVPSDIFFLALS